MKVRVQVIVETKTGQSQVVEEVACLERGVLLPDGLGLTLAEAKQLLAGVQRTLVMQQVAEYVAHQQRCPDCGTLYRRKGQHEVVVRTVFGKLQVLSPRFYTCVCRPQTQASFSPLAALLRERTTPELLYLEAKFAALVSYGATVDLLGEVLPIGDDLAVASVHRQVQQVAQRAESELEDERPNFVEGCPRTWANLPPPEGPLAVALDVATSIRAKPKAARKAGLR